MVEHEASKPNQNSALVTGGAKRVGAAIARSLVEAGYAVVIHANSSLEEAEALAAQLRQAGGKAQALRADLSKAPEREGLIAKARACFGPLSLLVNSAAIFRSDRLTDFSEAAFFDHMTVNLLAPLCLARDFAAQALPAANPSIVNLVDHRVLKLTPQHFTYTLSKAALYAATTTMAQELAPNIRVNAIGPGPTLPNPRDGAKGLEHEASGVPLGRMVDPYDIAEAVLYLARAKSVTGEMIAVDSGQHIGWQTPDIIPDEG
jgi:NAD(P)-dependent dehydrogenase (short-subunit alcohol dehydrogenase family)